MHQVNRQAIIRHSASEMFDLVNDVEQYPQFLNWCHSSHLLEKREDYMVAGLTVSLVGIKQKFTTKNTFTTVGAVKEIALSLVDGPFAHLTGLWIFTPLHSHASKIELHLQFNFKSGFMNRAFKRAFEKIATQLVADFVLRAKNVYR